LPSIILKPFLIVPKNEKRKKVPEQRSLKSLQSPTKTSKKRSFKNQDEMIPESTSLK